MILCQGTVEHGLADFFCKEFFLTSISLFGCAVSQLWQLGSGSLTRNGTQAPCIGSTESKPLDHLVVPQALSGSVLHVLVITPRLLDGIGTLHELPICFSFCFLVCATARDG